MIGEILALAIFPLYAVFVYRVGRLVATYVQRSTRSDERITRRLYTLESHLHAAVLAGVLAFPVVFAPLSPWYDLFDVPGWTPLVVLVEIGLVAFLGIITIEALRDEFRPIYGFTSTEVQAFRIRLSRDRGGYLFVCAVLALVSTRLLLPGLVPVPRFLYPLTLVAIGLGFITYGYRDAYFVAPSSLRTPTEAERARIDRAYERFGRTPGTALVAGPSRHTSSVMVYGPVDAPTVGIDEAFLESVDDDELGVGLVLMDELNRQGFWAEILSVMWFLLVSLCVSLYLGGITFLNLDGRDVGVADGFFDTNWPWPLASFVIVYTLFFLVLTYFLRRHFTRATFRADACAVSHFGPRLVADVLERHATDHLVTFVDSTHVTVPSVRRRVDRIVDRRSIPVTDESES